MTEQSIVPEHDYYYGAQIRRYIAQFSQVFAGMYVTVGKNKNAGTNRYVRVPIVYGSPDKVVASIKSEHVQNKPPRLPLFSIKLESISINMDRKSGTNTEYRNVVFPAGGDITKDMKTLYRSKPLPYNFTFGVTAYTTNSDQMFQLLEQILMLFDPLLQFQTSDARYDWTKIVDAELTGISIDDNRSADTDGRIMQVSFDFEVRLYMAPPANIKNTVIKDLRLRVEAVAGPYSAKEFIEDIEGDLPPYTEIFNLDDADAPPN